MFATEVNTIITKYHNYRWNKVTICMHSLHREQNTDSSWQDWARPSKFPHVSSLIFLKDLAWTLVSQSYTNKNCHANWILAQLFMKFISNFNSVLKNGSLKKKQISVGQQRKTILCDYNPSKLGTLTSLAS